MAGTFFAFSDLNGFIYILLKSNNINHYQKMKKVSTILIQLLILASCKTPAKTFTDQVTAILPTVIGNFMDDYGIRYSISDTLWVQHPNVKYHIIQWNKREQYLIAMNDKNNPSEAGLYIRIDYMVFQNMEPFMWGFCLTVYNATTEKEAMMKSQADRQNPKKGCGGFPFSRMKKAAN